MSDRSRFLIELFAIFVVYVILQIDETYITAPQKESGALMERQCQIEPKNCWLQKRAHK